MKNKVSITLLPSILDCRPLYRVSVYEILVVHNLFNHRSRIVHNVDGWMDESTLLRMIEKFCASSTKVYIV